MSRHQVAHYEPVRCTLRMPDLGLVLGPVKVDPLAALGVSVDELLGPYCVSRSTHEVGDQRWIDFEVVIPHGHGNAMEVPVLGGELGFGSQMGCLVLRVPMRLAYDAARQLEGRLRVIGGQAMIPTGTGHSADLLVEPSGELQVDLGPLGSVWLRFR